MKKLQPRKFDQDTAGDIPKPCSYGRNQRKCKLK